MSFLAFAAGAAKHGADEYSKFANREHTASLQEIRDRRLQKADNESWDKRYSKKREDAVSDAKILAKATLEKDERDSVDAAWKDSMKYADDKESKKLEYQIKSLDSQIKAVEENLYDDVGDIRSENKSKLDTLISQRDRLLGFSSSGGDTGRTGSGDIDLSSPEGIQAAFDNKTITAEEATEAAKLLRGDSGQKENGILNAVSDRIYETVSATPGFIDNVMDGTVRDDIFKVTDKAVDATKKYGGMAVDAVKEGGKQVSGLLQQSNAETSRITEGLVNDYKDTYKGANSWFNLRSGKKSISKAKVIAERMSSKFGVDNQKLERLLIDEITGKSPMASNEQEAVRKYMDVLGMTEQKAKAFIRERNEIAKKKVL